jgi:hypothetical protein
MREEFKPAIEALQTDLADLEKQVLDTKLVINRLCVRAGMEPLYPDASATTSSTVSAVRSDSFYGKSTTTAAREFLEMRRSAGLGPATPREVYEALAKGGYTFEAKDATTAIIGVRATMRKSSAIFHRLPNGTYGLLSWYPNAKPVREDDNDIDEAPRSARKRLSVVRKKKGNVGGTAKRSAGKETHEPKADRIKRELTAYLSDGSHNRADILKHMIEKRLMGYEQNPLANLSAYLSRWKDLVTNDAEGNWSLVGQKNEPQRGEARAAQ